MNVPAFDPYDLWASPWGVSIRERYYRGNHLGKIGAVALGLLDWLFPQLARRLVVARKVEYPIVIAHVVLQTYFQHSPVEVDYLHALRAFRSTAAIQGAGGQWSWGLGFPWMSKNGLYGPDIPFVTHTPYVMEALLVLADQPELHDEAMNLFHGTWNFLESLKVMHRGKDELALSYAPVEEPRIVVNANSYAAFAYALHSVHGKSEVRDEASLKAKHLARWVVRQQQTDGSWFYYADREHGNFIDCFHSCFVIKNLLKVKRLLPDLEDIVEQPIDKGWRYIKEKFFDRRAGLCRRFTVRSHRDPFRWDLYDQAEFLGLLVDFGELDRAIDFARCVEKRFSKGSNWYCRIDVFGRRWGRNFLRWGIMPFWYHRSRLEKAVEGK